MKSPRTIGKPRDRDYGITLQADVRTVVFNADGTIRSDLTHRQDSRVTRLVVKNSWRQYKPAKLDFTARTLLAWKRIHPHMTVTLRDKNGRLNRVSGPHWGVLNAEWNARYLNLPDTSYDEQLRTEAVLQALTKVKDQKWNAGVALAESQGVAQMACDAMELIVSVRKKLKRGSFKEAYEEFRKSFRSRERKFVSYPTWRRKYWRDIRHVKSVQRSKKIPEGWLYYNFALAPTIADITDMADAHATALNPLLFGEGNNWLHARGYAKQTLKEKRTMSQGRAYNGTIDHAILRSVRVTLPVHSKGKFVSKLSELGVTNPPEALWNRLPFSWAWDYFNTFGSWLSVLDTSLGWEWADKWSESWRVVVTSRFTPVSNSHITYEYPKQVGLITYKYIDRRVRGDLYGPMGSILPSWKRRGPSLKKVSNLLSVLASSMRLKIRP